MTTTSASKRCLSYASYVDKILGCWVGKSAGGAIGAPVEGQKMELRFAESNCWPKEIAPNDDLDIQLVWLEALQEFGPWLDSETLARFWQDRCWYGFAEYGYFLLNVQRGIAPPLSGLFNNSYFRESMGCPIRSEIWGVVCPGHPALAAHYAGLDGCLDHDEHGVSVHAERMLAAAAAEAFFAESVEACLDAGLAQLPGDSALADASALVRGLCATTTDWRRIRRALVRRYGHRDGSRALVNQAFTQMALRLGEGDFGRTLVLALNCGWDTDCTAATAGALVGILLGHSGLPEDWKRRVGTRVNSNIEVRHDNCLLTELADDCARVGVEIALVREPSRTEIIDAPPVAPRPRPEKTVRLAVRYLDAPVLWREREAEALLELVNESDATRTGTLKLSPPPGLRIAPVETALTLAPGEPRSVAIRAGRAGDGPLWDKNLVEAVWRDASGAVSKTFGWVGARQWRVYGPYYDVYDTTLHDECPFHNDRIVANPALVPGCARAGAHMYVRLDRPYLDEARLVREDLPDEDPYDIELGEDLIEDRDLGGFVGEAVYYLTRRVVAPEALETAFAIGASGPFAVWVNGEETFRWTDGITWAPYDFDFRVRLTEGINRLVVKAVRPTDVFRFSLTPTRIDAFQDRRRGVSQFHDCLGDAPPPDARPLPGSTA